MVAFPHVPAGIRVGGELRAVCAATASERSDGGGVHAQGDFRQLRQQAVERAYGGVQQELREQGQTSLALR